MIVILSTFNGESRLRDMFEAMLRIRIPEGTRFHVVDNASTDQTRAVLAQYESKLPLTVHQQPVRGKNNCLNLVLDKVVHQLAPDELVVLTDDDILPSIEWLDELQAAANAHSDCDIFAGRILPHWPANFSPCLEPVRRYYGILFSLTSNVEGPCDATQAWGPNMAVRAHVFQSGVRFDPRFGPNSTIGYPMGSETELMERLDQAGHRAWFAERACVRHMIRASQLNPSSVVQRAFRHGYGVAWRYQRGRGRLGLATLMFRALRGVVAAQIRSFWSSADDQLLQDYHEAWARGLASGALFEYRRARRVPTAAELFPETAEHLGTNAGAGANIGD